ncbi:hypothetical protein AMETH_1966 [Amycolatopsis methanolica 239]|uniref:Uncharacterized protein n=1 Tax=Amycolatopsis methanolica 239 TaxID=1068978 RepID=A0A076MMI4_AMYME|nr:hypothetical protein AMETH_1966 [Amycolatopsis methanolica 239]
MPVDALGDPVWVGGVAGVAEDVFPRVADHTEGAENVRDLHFGGEERPGFPLGVRDTGGRPPVWAWRGELRLIDAMLLFDAEHELSRGFAAVEFDAPAGLVVESDYGRWNDFIAASLEGRECTWELGPAVREPAQMCLPYVRASWVREVRPLPTGGWDRLDPAAAV